ncbi:hypothetical protein ACKKBF_B18705 [Auxenochlorella protothecoides x Auxenochlorella symbiontica]
MTDVADPVSRPTREDKQDGEPGLEAGPRDTRFEFDAPRYYDFGNGSPESTMDRPDDWFSTKATAGGKTGGAVGFRWAGLTHVHSMSRVSEPIPMYAGLRTPPGIAKDSNPPAPTTTPKASQSLENKLASPPAGKASSKRPALASITNTVLDVEAATAAVAAVDEEQDTTIELLLDDGPIQDPPQGSAPAPEKGAGAQPSRPDPPVLSHGITGKAARAVVLPQQPEVPAPRRTGQPSHRAGPASQTARPPGEAGSQPQKKARVHGMRTRSAASEEPPPASPWRSRAERIAEFEGRQPARSSHAAARTRAGGRAGPAKRPRNEGAETGAGSGLTLPRSPALATRKRARPPRFKPREEVEAEEMAAMPPFRARQLDKSMFSEESKQRGVPIVAPRLPTAQDPFHLVTDRRAAAHARAPGIR